MRAKILLALQVTGTYKSIATNLNISIKQVSNCYHRYIKNNKNVLQSLKDLPRSGRRPIFDLNQQLMVLNLACQRPKDIVDPDTPEENYASEFWTQRALANHVSEVFPSNKGLSKINQSAISKLYKKNIIKPQQVKYYLESRDPNFDTKMEQVLQVYKQVQDGTSDQITVSIDEKTAIQALGSHHRDIMPSVSNGQKTVYQKSIKRDPEYIRHGRVNIIAGVTLQNGKILERVADRNNSKEFVEFLKLLDRSLDKSKQIRLLADNYGTHFSKETQSYLNSLRPLQQHKRIQFSVSSTNKKIKIQTINYKKITLATVIADNGKRRLKVAAIVTRKRFTYVFLPTHGSWLNAIEGVFSKMARTFLKGIRVNSKEELKTRIVKGIQELNRELKPPCWKKYLDRYFNKKRISAAQ